MKSEYTKGILSEEQINKIENSKFLSILLRIYRFIKFKIKDFAFEFLAFFRRIGFSNKKNKDIKIFKDKYKGQRCFIIATGPSLKNEDILMLNDEITFGVNSLCMLFKELNWEPTFYGVQDSYIFEKFEDYVRSIKESTVFVSKQIEKKFKTEKDWIQMNVNMSYHQYEQNYGRYFAKFSNDAYHKIYDGYSITYSMIQLAIYMGFSKIYLLGTDCNYSKNGKNHIVDYGLIDRTYMSAGERMICALKVAKEYADKHNVEIINCSRGGMLEIFKRESLEEVLTNKEIIK